MNTGFSQSYLLNDHRGDKDGGGLRVCDINATKKYGMDLSPNPLSRPAIDELYQLLVESCLIFFDIKVKRGDGFYFFYGNEIIDNMV